MRIKQYGQLLRSKWHYPPRSSWCLSDAHIKRTPLLKCSNLGTRGFGDLVIWEFRHLGIWGSRFWGHEDLVIWGLGIWGSGDL